MIHARRPLVPGLFVVSLGIAVLTPNPATAQAASRDPVRVGLVLSGGSAKGFAHAGVIRVLEREGVPVHLVSGTSMGSIVGGLYALGVGVDSIISVARNQDWGALFTDRIDRARLTPDQRAFDARTVISLPFVDGSVRLPTGAVRGASIQRLLDELTWRAAAVRDFDRLPRPFAAVATDLETGEGVPLRSGVLADALRASMAIPGAIDPLVVGERTLVDGGLARNLPAQDVQELGADLVICSDVSGPLLEADELESMLAIVQQTASYRMTASTVAQRERCDILIRPDVEGPSPLDFEAVDEWLERGERAAEAAVPELRRAVREMDFAPPPAVGSFPAALPDSVRVTGLTVDHPDPRARRMVARFLDLDDEPFVSARRLDVVAEEIYATGLVGPVRYRVDAAAGDTTLTVVIDGGPRDQVGFGFRYDDRQRAALLFTGTLYDRLQWGSATRLDLRLGEELQARASYIGGRSVTGLVGVGGEVGYTRSPVDLYAGEQRVAEFEVEVFSLGAFLGLTPERASTAAVEVRGERVLGTTEFFITDESEKTWLGSAALWFLRETYDRIDFPRRGMRLYLRSELGHHSVEGGNFFSHHLAQADMSVPLHPRLSARLGAHVGYNTGDETPLPRVFFLGGDHRSPLYPATQPTFAGIPHQFELGDALQVARAALQFEPTDGRFVIVGVDAGAVREEWRIDLDEWRTGWYVTGGAATPVGPVSVRLSGGNGELRWAFNVGRRF